MDIDHLYLVNGTGKKGRGKGKNEKAKGQGDERRYFHCDGKGHIKSNCPQEVIDDKKSDFNSSSSTDTVMSVTVVATAREKESSDELWIFAIAVGGSLGSGAPGEIVELMVDRGADVTTRPPCVPVKLVGANGHPGISLTKDLDTKRKLCSNSTVLDVWSENCLQTSTQSKVVTACVQEEITMNQETRMKQ